MDDYIKKAVELADGWEAADSNHIRGPVHPTTWLIVPDGVPQYALDALAAQLVRQVDAKGGNLIVVKQASTTILGANDPPIFKHCSYGDDRTMNTIKAIVDSGVLTVESSDD